MGRGGVVENSEKDLQMILDRCFCGNTTSVGCLAPFWTVTETGSLLRGQDLPNKFLMCLHCGVVRQAQLSFNDYEDFYLSYPPTTKKYTAKDFDHDTVVAEARFKEYGLYYSKEKLILDVGSGSGAFIYVCRLNGHYAYGCEIATYAQEQCSEYVVRKRFEVASFCHNHFDYVTVHDVLEHVLDPILFTKELYEVTKPKGGCVVDFPNFFVPAGQHHWKDSEHIWFFNTDQLIDLMQDAGFRVEDVKCPIPSKIVVYCIKG